jgi:hypothetical protein
LEKFYFVKIQKRNHLLDKPCIGRQNQGPIGVGGATAKKGDGLVRLDERHNVLVQLVDVR